MTWEDMLSLKCKGMSESRIAILIKILGKLFSLDPHNLTICLLMTTIVIFNLCY